MPKIPSRETVTPELLVNNLQHTASSVRARFKTLAEVIASNNVSATNVGQITGDLVVLRRALAEAVENPKMADFAAQKFGAGYEALPDDIQIMIGRLDETITAIHALVPAGKDGYLKLVKWDGDGTWAWDVFAPEQLVPLRDLVTAIVANIDGKD